MVEPFAYETQFDLTRTVPKAVLKALIHGAQEWYEQIYDNARESGGLGEWYEDDEESIREFRAVTAALTFMLKEDSTRTFPGP
jgi:hypothetical protein